MKDKQKKVNEKPNNKKKNRAKVIVPVVIALGLIGFGGYKVYSYVNDNYNALRMASPVAERNLDENASIIDKAKIVKNSKEEKDEVKEVTPNKELQELSPTMEKEYDDAKAVSKDVVGWITIPGTNINYPVNYNGQPNYYLKHNWKNQKSWHGAISIDARNKGYQNWTLINGHNMLDGIMFSQLLKYDNMSFAKEHPYVYLYKGNGDIASKYEVIGAVYVPQTVDFQLGDLTKEQMSQQIDKLLSDKIYKINEYNGNNILMLNTCLSRGKKRHILVITQEVIENNVPV